MISGSLFGYANYANQNEINYLSREIYIVQEQHKILLYRYNKEREARSSYRRLKAYVKKINQLRDKAIYLVRRRNELVLDKRRFIQVQERERLALYAREDKPLYGGDIDKIDGKLSIKIDLSSQKMSVSKGKYLLYEWQVSTAMGGYRTPKGDYQPYHTERMHYSRLYDNSPMPYSIFFKDGYAIHGTHYTRSLGCRASHGCVRLRTSNAKKLYDLVKKSGYKNTTIKIRS